MDIIMTIDTFFANLPETPFGILFMTGETGSSQVSPGELKFALIMPLNCEVRLFKAQGGMTIGTIGGTAVSGKLSIMVI